MRRTIVRILYVLCAASVLSFLWLFASGQLADLLWPGLPIDVADLWPMALMVCGAPGLLFLVIALRLDWWGKIFSSFAAFSWLGNTGVLYWTGLHAPITWIAAAGCIALATAIAHQVVDPRWGD